MFLLEIEFSERKLLTLVHEENFDSAFEILPIGELRFGEKRVK